MKAILEFDLNQPDDRVRHLAAVKADDTAFILWELYNNSYQELYAKISGKKLSKYKVLDIIFTHIRELMEAKGIDPNELTY